MLQHDFSDPTVRVEPSPFGSAQNALARKALPGPTWAWAGLAAIAVSALGYLVTRSPAPAHAAHPPSSVAAEPGAAEPGAPPAEAAPGSSPAVAAASTSAAAEPAAPATAAEPAAPATAVPAASDGEHAATPTQTAPVTASEGATEPTAGARSKKKARGSAHRSSRKRAATASVQAGPK